MGLSLAYIVIAGSLGPPDTLDRAYPFLEQKRVAFGFPDILFGPDDAYARLITRQEQTGADVVLGLHEIEDPRVWDMVDCDKAGLVRDIVMKPASTLLTMAGAARSGLRRSRNSSLVSRADETRHQSDRLASRVNDPGGDLAVGVVLELPLRPGSQSNVKFPGNATSTSAHRKLKAVQEFQQPIESSRRLRIGRKESVRQLQTLLRVFVRKLFTAVRTKRESARRSIEYPASRCKGESATQPTWVWGNSATTYPAGMRHHPLDRSPAR